MKPRTIKIAAGVLAVLSVAGIATIIISHRSTPASPAAQESVRSDAKPSEKKPAKPLAVAVAEAMTLEQWNERISETDISAFRSLMDAAMQIEDPELRNTVIVAITDRWLKEDPSNFNKYLAALEVHGDEAKLSYLVLAMQESLTKLDPQQASSDEVLIAVQRLIAYLAEHDPDLALAWAKKWLLDDTLESALASVARGYARTDIAKALAVIDTITSPLRRGQALATVGGIWALTDPAAALKWSMALPNLAERALTLNQVLLATAKMDLDAAAQQLKQQAEVINANYQTYRDQEMAKNGVSGIDEANDPERYKEAMEAGLILPPSSPDVELMADAGHTIGTKMGNGDGEKAVSWAESLENEFLKAKAVTGALEGWAKTDAEAALSYLNENYPDDTEMLKSIYASWASIDQTGAADGVKLISDPAKRALALEAVVTSWTAKGNTAEAVAYLNQLPASEVSDGTKTVLVNAMSQSTPQEAWQLAQTINDPRAQFRALKNAFSNLVIQSPAQASALLASSSLSNDASGRLQDMLDAVVGE